MASSIDQGFRVLRSNLEITDLQEQTVSTRQTNVRAAVEDDFEVLDSFLTGSYRRNTLIAPLNEADIDVFVVLHTRHYAENGQKELLEALRRSLRKKYPSTPAIRADGQAVTIKFTDFRIDAVPGFYRTGGGFLIPDATRGRWIATDPKQHVKIWSTANSWHNGSLVPLIKMIKAWNKSRQFLKSFHLEVLVLKTLEGITINSYPSGVRYFFDHARNRVHPQLSDPAGFNPDVAAHLTSPDEMDNIVQRMTWAYERAVEAENFARQGRIQDAFTRWDQIFKGYFPSYG